MGYGTPEKAEEYESSYIEGKEIRKNKARYTDEQRDYGDKPWLRRRATERYKEPTERAYGQKGNYREKAGRVITGLKSIGKGTAQGARGFAKEIKTESIRSGFKTQRTLQRPLRRYQRTGSVTRRGREPRTRIRQYRPVMPPSAGLGERAVIEASQGYVPHLDRQYFSEGNEQRDLIGQSGRDMNLLVDTPESIQKKKEQRYY
jgi:hypothetical protein